MLKTSAIVLIHVFVIIAICYVHDIQYFTIIYGYTFILYGLIFDIVYETLYYYKLLMIHIRLGIFISLYILKVIKCKKGNNFSH